MTALLLIAAVIVIVWTTYEYRHPQGTIKLLEDQDDRESR